MTFVQRRNRLTTHFSERIPVVKRRKSIHQNLKALPIIAFVTKRFSGSLCTGCLMTW